MTLKELLNLTFDTTLYINTYNHSKQEIIKFEIVMNTEPANKLHHIIIEEYGNLEVKAISSFSNNRIWIRLQEIE